MAALRESTSPSSTHAPTMTLRSAGAWVPSGWLPDAVAAVSRVTPGYWAVRAISGGPAAELAAPDSGPGQAKRASKKPVSRSHGMAFLPPPSYRSVWTAPGMVTNSLLSPVSRAKASLPM